METFNNWLNTIQHNGRGVELYNATSTVCIVLLIGATLFCAWRQKTNLFKALAVSTLTFVFLIYAQHLVTWYRRGFELDRYMGTANVGYALILLPLLCWLCAHTFRLSAASVGELMAVTTLAWHWVGRSGCTFAGCCRGIPCEWGIYSKYAENGGGNTFPVCWVESALALGIFLFLLVRLLRRERGAPDNGRALPYTLLIYGTGRFCTEFLRYHSAEDTLCGFLPEFSVLALLMAAVGGACLCYAVRKKSAPATPEQAE